MKNIQITEPCSENWNKMTPTEKGAFCQKCALEVNDFTNKSGDEIRDILALNLGSRVCGRIEPKQLDQLNRDFQTWQFSSKQSFNRAWIFSLFVVFGMTLFSCEDEKAPAVHAVQQKAQSFFTNLPDEIELSEQGEKQVVESPITGQLHIEIPIVDDTDTLENVSELEDTLVVDTSAVVDDAFLEPEFDEREYMLTLGGFSVSTAYEEYLTEVTDIEAEEVMSTLVYPNPASNQTTLKVEMPTESDGEIQLFAMSGQYIRTIHAGLLPKGETEFSMDLTGLDSGNYLVIIIQNGEKETIQFSKM